MTGVRSDDQVAGAAEESDPAVDPAPGPDRPDVNRKRLPAGLGGLALALLVLLCGATMLLGFLNKDRCTGPHYNTLGRSEPNYELRVDRDVCYSDIQYLWLGRSIDKHVFPYIHGGISPDGALYGGTVEYPVLTGMLMWLGAIYAHNDHEFLLYSALLLAPFGLVTAWALGKLARWRALAWAIGPPLVLYAFHNWDLAVVACAVLAFYVVHRGWGRSGANRSLAARATVAGVLLGIGFAFKLYPIIFTPPLMLYVATGGEHGQWLRAGKKLNLLAPLQVALAAAGTAVLINLPFALLGYKGWAASFTFQEDRQVDITTNSLWFWAFRPFSNPTNKPFQQLVDVLSPSLILLSFVVALVLGWRRYRREGSYPWLPVCGAMLCGFLLFHKVHSPQYTLWLIPMFVLLRIRWGWVFAYFFVDACMGIGIFRYYYAISFGKPYGIYDGFAEQATVIGVWGRALLLAGLFFAFLAAPSAVREPDCLLDGDPEPLPA